MSADIRDDGPKEYPDISLLLDEAYEEGIDHALEIVKQQIPRYPMAGAEVDNVCQRIIFELEELKKKK